MKKLIAQRPIQYMGRTYESGEAIPAHDPNMVAAWLRANSAAWTGTDLEDTARAAVREAARRSKVNDLAAEAIRAMGVTIEDTAGEFVGASSMEEQIRAMFAHGSLQNGGGAGEGLDHGDGENDAQGGQNAPGEGENGQGGGTSAMLTGHLDLAKLERMKKEDLLDLAAKLGVDVSAAKNQQERAQLIAAAEVQATANPQENDGGAQ